MKFPGFCGGAYQSRSLAANAQRCVNLYPEIDPTAKGNPVLYGTPGLSLFCTLPTSPVRGLWVGENRLFAAGGTTVYEISSGGVATALTGSILSATTPVQMFPNGNQLFIVSGNKGYLADGVGAPDIVEVVNGVYGAFLDSYFLMLDNTVSPRRVRHSASQDGSSWPALDIAEKEGYPDALAAIFCDKADLYLFGTQTTEVWRNNQYPTDPEDFPWERAPGEFMHEGCIAPWSIVRLAEGVAWLAGSPRGNATAVWARGYRPQVVSTQAIEDEWATYSTVTDAEAFAYKMSGHEFWVISFPTAGKTWVYDVTTKFWHERSSGGGRWRARNHGYCFGKHFVGDYANGKIYQMSNAFYDDDGTAIDFERVAPYINDEHKEVFFHRLRLATEKATSLTVTLEKSNDSGVNWSTARNPDVAALDHGEAGRILHQDWRRLGSGRQTLFRVKGTTGASTESRIAILDAYLDLSPGTH